MSGTWSAEESKAIYMQLIAKYAEPMIKGPKERKRLERILKANIATAFPNAKISLANGIVGVESEIDISEGLSRIFGISNVCVCFECGNSPEEIAETIAENADRAKKYKIEAKRRFKAYPMTSTELAIGVSGLLDRKGVKMSVRGYDEIIYVEIEKEKAFCLFSRIEGVAGLPYGSGGRALILFSGGIDSPAAAYMLARRGLHLDALHFGNEISARQVKKIWEHLQEEFHMRGRFYFADNGAIMEELSKLDNEFRQMGLKAGMYIAASKVADELGVQVLATGESIGQVSTQTLDNLALLDSSTDKFVLRPLIGMTKDDIIAIAVKIGTYRLSACLPEMCKVSKRPRVRIKEQRFAALSGMMKNSAGKAGFREI
jgi:thiamine biosynthesis protein ThiI